MTWNQSTKISRTGTRYPVGQTRSRPSFPTGGNVWPRTVPAAAACAARRSIFPKRRGSLTIRKPGFPAPIYVKISPARFTALCPDAA